MCLSVGEKEGTGDLGGRDLGDMERPKSGCQGQGTCGYKGGEDSRSAPRGSVPHVTGLCTERYDCMVPVSARERCGRIHTRMWMAAACK